MEHLALNRETGKYELRFTLSIEAEIFRRVLFSYADQNSVDPADLRAWEQAVMTVSTFERWRNHPHATVCLATVCLEEATQPTPSPQEPVQEKHLTEKISEEELHALRTRAINLPQEQWETLLTPIPAVGNKYEKQPAYRRRSEERKVLEALKSELAPAPLAQFEAVALAMKSNGIH